MRTVALGWSLALALLVAACSSSASSDAAQDGRPDPAEYRGACSADDDCTLVLATDCARGCPPERVAVLASRGAAFTKADGTYAAATCSSTPCPTPLPDGKTARCQSSACAVDAIVAPPKASDFAEGCTTDADCVIVIEDSSPCCRGCGDAILVSRQAEYAAASERHAADCRRASLTNVACPGAPCAGTGKATCAPGTGTRRCIRA